MTMLKMRSTPFSSRTKTNVVQMMPSTLLHISFFSTLISRRHMRVCFLLILPQLFVILEKKKAMKVHPFMIKWCHSFLTDRSQIASQSDPLPLHNHKHGRPPPSRDVSVLLNCTHSTQKTVHPQTRVTSLSNLQMIPQFSAYCLPVATLICTSPK